MTGAGGCAAVTVLSRHWNVGLNLYALSDGSYWLDDVGNDAQGFVTQAQADTVRQFTVRSDEYEAEPFALLLARYVTTTGRGVEQLSATYSRQGRLYSEPGRSFYFTTYEHDHPTP